MSIKTRLDKEQTYTVLHILDQFLTNWNNKDLESFGKLFSRDAEFTDVIGQTAIGREAIVKQHRYPFENVMKFATLEIKDHYIRPLADNLIMVSALWKVTGSLTPGGDKLADRNGVIQLILKTDSTTNQTLIQLVHNSDNALPYEKKEAFIE